MFNPDPASIVKLYAHGVAGADMGTVADPTTVPRFTLPTPGRFVLVNFKATFSGGSGSATLEIRLDQRSSGEYRDVGGVRDFLIDSAPTVGTGGNADYAMVGPQSRSLASNVATTLAEYERTSNHPLFVFSQGEYIVPVWTNPNTQTWAIEVTLAPVGGF